MPQLVTNTLSWGVQDDDDPSVTFLAHDLVNMDGLHKDPESSENIGYVRKKSTAEKQAYVEPALLDNPHPIRYRSPRAPVAQLDRAAVS